MYKFYALISSSRCGANWLASMLTDLRIGQPDEYFSKPTTDASILKTKVNLLGVRLTSNGHELAKLKNFAFENIDQPPFLIQLCRRDVIGQIVSSYYHKASKLRYLRQTKSGKPLQKYEDAYKALRLDEDLLEETISQILEERDLQERSLYFIKSSGHVKVYYEDLFDSPIGVLSNVANTIYMASADSVIKAYEKSKLTQLVARDFYQKKLTGELEAHIRASLGKRKSSERK